MRFNANYVTPPDSPISRRDPRWRLAALVLAIICIAIIRNPLPAAAALIFALAVAIVARVPRQWYLNRIGLLCLALIPFIVVIPFTVDRGERLWEWRWLAITDAGLEVAAAMALKTIALVTLALVLLASAPLHATLAAASKIGVPKLLVHLTLLTFRYVFLLLDEFNRLRIALRVRGFRNAMSMHAYRTVGQVTGTLLVRGSDRAEHVAQAMRCRGFDGRFRTLSTFQSTASDVLMFVVIVGIAGGFLAWDLLA